MQTLTLIQKINQRTELVKDLMNAYAETNDRRYLFIIVDLRNSVRLLKQCEKLLNLSIGERLGLLPTELITANNIEP